MGRLADRRAELQRQSLAWHTRPRLVWSDHGARRRQVRVVWRRGDRDMWRYEVPRMIAGLAFFVGLLLISAVVVSPLDDDRGDGPTYGLQVFAVLWALCLAMNGVAWSTRFVRTRRRPDPVEGTIVLREHATVPGEEGTVDLHWLAVDDGTADTVTAFHGEPEVYARLTVGDVVRVQRGGSAGRYPPVEALRPAAPLTTDESPSRSPSS